MKNPIVICLTPVKNESWILARFLSCASLWADHIIVADQDSDDGSREIAKQFKKVILIDNPATEFNEPERQRLLINAAREIHGQRLLIALDADEFLTANFLTSPEWHSILNAPPGTVIRFQWPIILEDFQSYWTYPTKLIFGFMDDGSEHRGEKIHSPRLPCPPNAKEIHLNQIKVMHYAFVDYLRWKSRQRWYQCYEFINQTHRRPVELYRFYHKDINIPSKAIKEIPKDWFYGYEEKRIDMTSIAKEAVYRWDKEVLEIMLKYGTKKFKRLSIWDINWYKVYAEQFGGKTNLDLSDPKSYLDKLIHKWVKKTQKYYVHYGEKQSWFFREYSRLIRKLIKFSHW